jgi:phosphotransferase system  glucose/maltose/N-acetylglucosamine-specific IIC component
MIAALQIDPRTAVYGVAMFLPLAAVILAGLATLAAVRGVLPGLIKTLAFTGIADISLIWYVAIGLVVVMLIILAMAALSGGKKSKKRTEAYRAGGK